MGCDGGTIPKRDELVKTKKKPEQKDKTSELAYRWKHCAVSQEPLEKPVVVCELGRMYNKDSVIEKLLDKTAQTTELISHIKSIKDVKEISLTESPTWTKASEIEKGDRYIDVQKAKWICPISGQEMNGRFRFNVIWTCGCVYSEKALKEMLKNKSGKVHSCLKCQKPFEMADTVLLNPIEETDINLLKEKMEARRTKAKDLKKSKKKEATATAVSAASASSTATEDSNSNLTSSDGGDSKNQKPSSSSSSSGIKNGNSLIVNSKSKLNGNLSTSSSSKKKLEEEVGGPSKKPKVESLSSKTTTRIGNYSVEKDPKASDTYKSLFTTSDKAKTKQTAHWVTYNPFYN